MKTTLSLCLTLVALAPLSAQVFRPEAVNGAVLGGIAGAVIGHNSGDLRHSAWRGAAIGAGAGLILGEAVGNANAASRGPRGPVARDGGYVYRDVPSVRIGVGYGSGYGRGAGYGFRGYDYGRGAGYGYRGHDYGRSDRGYASSGYYYSPAYSYYPGYGDDYPYSDTGYYGSGSGAANGLVLGALAGGIIGNNSGEFRHNGWRGAAWGAGLGWLLGSVADANRRAVVYQRAPVVVPAASAVPAQPVAQPAAQPITIINNYYNSPSPMSGANSLFGR